MIERILITMILMSSTAYAKFVCKDSTNKTPEQITKEFDQLAQAMMKKNIEKIGPDRSSFIIGKWYQAPKGHTLRNESKPRFEFMKDGKGLMRGQSFEYEVKPDFVVYSKPSYGDKKTDDLMQTDDCLYLFKIGAELYMPSRESGLTPIFK